MCRRGREALRLPPHAAAEAVPRPRRPPRRTRGAAQEGPRGDERVADDATCKQKMAQHMVTSMQTSPHVAAIHEVDMTASCGTGREHAVAFEQKEGFKLTFTPYIIDAVVRAIKKYPLINCSVDGTTIIRKNAINIGIAVASENGLIVPVIKHAEEKSLLGIARAVHDLAERTRARKLAPDDIQGGTFTISNYGVFGTIIGTPIINQPQVAILGTGAIVKRAGGDQRCDRDPVDGLLYPVLRSPRGGRAAGGDVHGCGREESGGWMRTSAMKMT